MSYLVLARKYRPACFESMTGQEHVVRALTHALESRRLHHAYLFTGTRGVGKTTLSRLLAKSLNCEKGITANPCGECAACVAIDADRFVDYIEMDAASNRGVANMQQLLEQAIYAPTSAPFKVYMIDEVHMLSREAFNAMLKTLEEPPPHVKFVLATTDPQKIPPTVLSRCLQFNLKQIPVPLIVERLDEVLTQESIRFERTALRLLAEGARGSMRDALSLADQSIAYTAGNITLSAVQDMMGSLDQTYLIRILDSVASREGNALLDIANEMADRNLSYAAALRDLGVLLNRIAMTQLTPAALSADLPEYADVVRLSAQFTPEEVQLFYQIVVHGHHDLSLAPDDYAGFSMTLIRLLAFCPNGEGSGGAHRDKISSPPARAAALPPSDGEAARHTASSLKTTVTSPRERGAPVREETAPAISTKKEPQREILSVAAPDEEADWVRLAQKLPLRGLVQQLAWNTELVSRSQSGNAEHFNLRTSAGALATEEARKRLEEALSGQLHCPVRVNVEIGKVARTVAAETEQKKKARQEEMEVAVQNDDYIQRVVQTLGARVVPGSVRAINNMENGV
ncbi:MAG: DNA polymerase III subunit gamma/tau [Burkholderiaceae bacterium]|jgi:DNA polymerase-3 subunit gamma/tau|nr:DNA polymerase III subunit gamma/tau [Burkholderiaceae bacterium]